MPIKEGLELRIEQLERETETLKGQLTALREASPIIAFQRWLSEYTTSHRKLTQDEYLIAQAAFIAAHPGDGPKTQITD